MLTAGPCPSHLGTHARQAVEACPVLALRLGAAARALARRRAPRPPADPDRAHGSTLKGRAEPMRVLVAEDDAGLREVLVLGLADAGYHVDAVDRGDDAIDQLKWYEYDVAVIDWRMPGADGIDVVAWARRHQRPDGAPDAHRARRAARTASGASTPAPTTTWSSRSTSASCWPASAPSSGGRAGWTRPVLARGPPDPRSASRARSAVDGAGAARSPPPSTGSSSC